MNKLTMHNVQELLAQLEIMALENRDYLIKLDGVMGDSDLGLTMVTVFSEAKQVATEYTESDIGVLFIKIGMAMAKAAPSTMGTLIATGFMRGGKAIKGAEQLDLDHISDFWTAFVNGLMERGKAKLGEKTIIDALYPASVSLKQSVSDGKDMEAAFQLAKIAADDGMLLTKTMVAQHGRAAYYQEKSRGIIDPGAVLGSLLIATFADYICQTA